MYKHTIFIDIYLFINEENGAVPPTSFEEFERD